MEFQSSQHVLKTDAVGLEAQATNGHNAATVAIGTAVRGIVGGLLGGWKALPRERRSGVRAALRVCS